MKQLLNNFKENWRNELPVVKWGAIGLTLVFGIVVGACTQQSSASDDGPFNGVDLHSPIEGGWMVRVDDGYNSCYVLTNRGGDFKMSCVKGDEDRGSDAK